jgi:hypothetical protein
MASMETPSLPNNQPGSAKMPEKEQDTPPPEADINIANKNKSATKEEADLQSEFLGIVDKMKRAHVELPKEFQMWFAIRDSSGFLGSFLNAKAFLTREAAQADCADGQAEYDVDNFGDGGTKWDAFHKVVVHGGNRETLTVGHGHFTQGENRGCDFDYKPVFLTQALIDAAADGPVREYPRRCFLWA